MHETVLVPAVELIEVPILVEVTRDIPVYAKTEVVQVVEEVIELGDTIERRVILPQMRKSELPQVKTII